MRLIVAAFYDEVAPLINTLDKKSNEIVITGPGKKNVEFATKRLNPSKYFEVINLGVAAGTNDLLIGTVSQIKMVVHNSHSFKISDNGLICHTVDNPLTESPSGSSLLFDMELYHLVSWSTKQNLPLKSMKIVSDHGTEDFSKIKGLIPELSQKLATHFMTFLNHSSH